jgi:hypothetical protein
MIHLAVKQTKQAGGLDLVEATDDFLAPGNPKHVEAPQGIGLRIGFEYRSW